MTDRLVHTHLPVIILLSLLFATVMNNTSTVSMECIFPAQFPPSWQNYAVRRCFRSGLYDLRQYILKNGEPIYSKKELPPFHWYAIIIFLLEFGALASLRAFLSLLNAMPQPLNKVLIATQQRELAKAAKTADSSDRLRAVVAHLELCMAYTSLHGKSSKIFLRHITFKFVAIIVVLAIAIFNLAIVTAGTPLSILPYSWLSLFNLAVDNGTLFPTDVGCEFLVFTLGNIQTKVTQCYLGINVWFQIVFFFHTAITFTCVFLLICSLSCKLIAITKTYQHARMRLWLHNRSINASCLFIRAVGIDGMAILEQLAVEYGEVTTSEIAHSLWENFQHRLKPHAVWPNPFCCM